MKFKKSLALFMACSMLFGASVSSNAAIIQAGADEKNTTITEETLNVVLASEPSTLWGAADGKIENESQYIAALLMDRLVGLDDEGNIVPELATAWEWVDDTHCKFTLRDDVEMITGEKLVADDVVYSVGVWRDCSANSDTGRYIVGAEANDEHTVTIEFTQKAPDLLRIMSWSNFGIVSEAQVEAAGGLQAVTTNPIIGSGKYKFVSWDTGTSILLERNDNYWNPDYAGYYKQIRLTFTPDGASRVMAVESGDAQLAADIPIAQAVTYQNNESINVVTFDYGKNELLWFNQTEGRATADKAVREAILKCIDYDAVAAVGSAGMAEKSYGYAAESSPYYTPSYTAEEKAQNIEEAKAILEEAGYGDGLELTILGLQDSVPAYTVIQECCRSIGITLTMDIPDVPTFVGSAFGGAYDMIVLGESLADRNPSILVFFDKETIQAGFCIGGPKVISDEYDSYINKIVEADEDEQAKEYLAELDQLLKEDCTYASLYPEVRSCIVGADVKGFDTIERGFVDLSGFYK